MTDLLTDCGCLAKNIFWRVVVARDMQQRLGDRVFASADCVEMGQNGEAGLLHMLPKKHLRSQDFTKDERLRALTVEVVSRLQKLLPPKLLEYLPPLYHCQMIEHNCCEYMQQHVRVNPAAPRHVARTPRCNVQLRKFFLRARHALLPDKARCVLETSEMTQNDIDAEPDAFMTDDEVLGALRRAYPDACTGNGWRQAWVRNLVALGTQA